MNILGKYLNFRESVEKLEKELRGLLALEKEGLLKIKHGNLFSLHSYIQIIETMEESIWSNHCDLILEIEEGEELLCDVCENNLKREREK